MRSLLLLAALALPALITGLPQATSKPEQIRSDQDPVFHYYLQAYPKNSSFPLPHFPIGFPLACLAGLRRKTASLVVLGPVATSEYFNIGGTIQSTNTSLYLNVGADTTSYKTLTFEKTPSTKAWTLEGDTIITQTSSSYGRRECIEGAGW